MKKADLIPPGWFEAWADATFATDLVGAKQTPPVLRAPNGVVQDGQGRATIRYNPKTREFSDYPTPQVADQPKIEITREAAGKVFYLRDPARAARNSNSRRGVRMQAKGKTPGFSGPVLERQ